MSAPRPAMIASTGALDAPDMAPPPPSAKGMHRWVPATPQPTPQPKVHAGEEREEPTADAATPAANIEERPQRRG